MATHSSILAWRIPWTEESCGLQSMGLQRVRHNWVAITPTQVNMQCKAQLWPTLLTPWTVACRLSLSTGFSWWEYWSGWPFTTLGDFRDSGTEPVSPASLALGGGFFTTVLPGKPKVNIACFNLFNVAPGKFKIACVPSFYFYWAAWKQATEECNVWI